MTTKPDRFSDPTRVRVCLSWAVLVVALESCLFPVSVCGEAAESLKNIDAFVRQLRQPHTGLVDGQGFRKAIQIVADPPGSREPSVNVWIDRKVNPDAAISPGPLGPTRYASLCRIARAAGCVCYPLDNCILIGRPGWVAAVLERIFSDPSVDDPRGRVQGKSAAVDIGWPDLTTPDEALAAVLRSGPGGGSVGEFDAASLPHDLWPAVAFTNVSPDLMAKLIRGQFLPAEASGVALRQSYQFPGHERTFDAVTKVDPRAQLSITGPRQQLTASAAAHVWLCEQLLGAPVGGGDKPVGPGQSDVLSQLRTDERTFSLSVRNEPVGRVIRTLVASTQFPCKIDPAANPKLEQLVSLTAKDKTLWELLRLITQEASLKIEAAEGSLWISAK